MPGRTGTTPKWIRRLCDFAAYVAIALALGIGTIWCTARFGAPGPEVWKWIGFGMHTALLFGAFVKYYRQPHFVFWQAVALMFIIHVVIWVAIVSTVGQWKTVWFMIMYPAEAPIMFLVGERTDAVVRRRKRMRHD